MSNNARPTTQRRYLRLCIIIAVLLTVVLLAVFLLPRLLDDDAPLTSYTTYTVESVTYGSVDTTISGSGTLTPVTRGYLTADATVTLTAFSVAAGASLTAGDTIATATDATDAAVTIVAPYDCVVLELSAAAGDTVKAGDNLALLMGKDGFTMGIAVDEYDIATVKVGQEVSFSVPAVDGTYTGTITSVSYNGSTSGSATAYQLTASLAYAEGIYPGMSVSAEIVIESSGEGLLVPVDAIRTSGDTEYVCLAPAGSIAGDTYTDEDLTLADLTRVTVTTGDSDGSYLLVTADELSEGDLIVRVTQISTQTGGSSDGNGGNMGGFPGGGGMNFGDFDFGSFDPGNMPQGFPGRS